MMMIVIKIKTMLGITMMIVIKIKTMLGKMTQTIPTVSDGPFICVIENSPLCVSTYWYTVTF